MTSEHSTPGSVVRAAIYARVSTTDQNNTIQVQELSDYVARRGWQLAGIYQDQLSGANASRPGLERLMSDARCRRLDVVLVWKLDRFGRGVIHCVNAIQELQAVGVRFIAVSQGIDTDESNPASKLLTHILAAIAQFERELIRERVTAGVRHAQRNGKRIGRPRKIFDREEVVRLRREGLSFEKIARQMGLGVGTVVRVLRSQGATPEAFQKSSAAALDGAVDRKDLAELG